MAIGQWFNEGASARSAASDRGDCPYPDGEARSEWLDGFDEAGTFENDAVAYKSGQAASDANAKAE